MAQNCYRDRQRICGPDCVAYLNGSVDMAWKHCQVLVTEYNLAHQAIGLSQTVRLIAKYMDPTSQPMLPR